MAELAPPEPRPRFRLAVAGVAAIIVLGGAGAAVVTRHPRTVHVDTTDEGAVALLGEQINMLETEVKTLRAQLATSAVTQQQLYAARATLVQKEREILSLTQQITTLTAAHAIAPKPVATQSEQVTRAVASSAARSRKVASTSGRLAPSPPRRSAALTRPSGRTTSICSCTSPSRPMAPAAARRRRAMMRGARRA